MKRRTLREWLRWQESLHPREIELGLGRVRTVGERLPLHPPPGGVFSVAGTNGKGSTVAFLDAFLTDAGRTVGAYTSPHLVRYNERVRVRSEGCDDAVLIAAFEEVAEACRDVRLTYFEFGTLAALLIFSQQHCDVWLLEVGLGGRLDAVNVVDADFSIITTVALDHQDWLGDSVEQIAHEKAGIFRPGRPAFYGDTPVPDAILRHAGEIGAVLRRLGHDFDFSISDHDWQWRGERESLAGLIFAAADDRGQLNNISTALAALEQYDRSLLDVSSVARALTRYTPAGRFQLVERNQLWILDVAHNVQAALNLAGRLRRLKGAKGMTIVLGMMANKQVHEFVSILAEFATHWIVCDIDEARAMSGNRLAAEVAAVSSAPVTEADAPAQALALAQRLTAAGDRILVCGSFRTVGPALKWLGLQ